MHRPPMIVQLVFGLEPRRAVITLKQRHVQVHESVIFEHRFRLAFVRAAVTLKPFDVFIGGVFADLVDFEVVAVLGDVRAMFAL